MYQVLGHDRASAIDRIGCLHNGLMNMTYIALRFSRFVNGVAMQHGKRLPADVPRLHPLHHQRRPRRHLALRALPAAPRRRDPLLAHRQPVLPLRLRHRPRPTSPPPTARASSASSHEVATRTGQHFDPNVLTLGFARRVATYKRASLLFHDPARLVAIAEKIGGLQILYAGKAHPADNAGKGLIRDVFAAAAKLNSSALKIVYLENYDWELGALLTQGVDVWVNTPRRPYEASGTSGMKAALNGVPSLSILDGWWIEGCAENTTGWAIEDAEDEDAEAASLYDKARKLRRPHVRQPRRLGRACSALHRHQRQLLQHPPHAGPVLRKLLLPPDPVSTATPTPL